MHTSLTLPQFLIWTQTRNRAVFGDLCTYKNLPLLTVNVNVYCDGVYDLCHIGHKNLFKAALKFGTRLYVGVVGDKDAMNYKRPPIMTMEERAAEVRIGTEVFLFVSRGYAECVHDLRYARLLQVCALALSRVEERAAG